MYDLDAYAAYLSEARRRGLPVAVGMVALSIAWLGIISWQFKAWQPGLGLIGGIAVLFGPFFVIVIGGLVWLTRLGYLPQFGCPACGALIQKLHSWAIATRRCPHCEERIFGSDADIVSSLSATPSRPAQPPSTDVRQRGHTVDERVAAIKAHGRRWTILIFTSIGAIVVSLLAAYGLRELFRPFLTRLLGETWVELVPALGPGLVLPPLAVVLFLWIRRADAHDDRLACPHCKRPELGIVALRLTGNCSKCGGRVASPFGEIESATPSNSGALLPLRRFAEASNAWHLTLVWMIVGLKLGVIAFAILGSAAALIEAAWQANLLGAVFRATAWVAPVGALAAVV